MRIGTTSYIYPADILPNVRALAGKVEDIELLLFEVDDRFNNLPNQHTIAELRQIALDAGMTYTVHLPLDLRLASNDNMPSVSKAKRVIEHMNSLAPFGFVVHVEGDGPGPVDVSCEFDNAVRAVGSLAAVCASPELLCVEYLEGHPPELIDGVLTETAVSCCVDVGHLWKCGEDPRPHLERWLPRTRVVHLHGVGGRDHQRLSLMSESQIDDVVRVIAPEYEGIITLEIFNEADLLASMDALRCSIGRVTGQ